MTTTKAPPLNDALTGIGKKLGGVNGSVWALSAPLLISAAIVIALGVADSAPEYYRYSVMPTAATTALTISAGSLFIYYRWKMALTILFTMAFAVLVGVGAMWCVMHGASLLLKQ